MELLKCSKCGNEINGTDKFCPNCGNINYNNNVNL